MINRRSFISGIKSTTLSKKEINFLNRFKPWGIILFSRNIKSLGQLEKLTSKIRKIFKDDKYPILLDQEGGRVNRLSKFFNAKNLTGKYFGNLFLKDKVKFKNDYGIFIKKTSEILKQVGVNINTVPILDIFYSRSSDIIGDRAFFK